MTTSGIEEVGRDLSQTEVAVYSLVDGSWRRFEGIGTSDGSYEVEFDGPVERLVLQVGDRYRQIEEVSAEDTYLFATATARRADAALSNDETFLRLQYSALSPWRDGDSLVVFSPDAGCNFVVYGFAPDLPPPFGATTMDATVDYGRFSDGELLIDAGAGDLGYLMQMRDSISGLGRELEVIRSGEVSVAQVPGSFETTTGELANARSDPRLEFRFDVPSFAAALGRGDEYDGPFAELFASIPAIDGQFLEPSAWLYGLIPGRVAEPSVVSIGAPAIFPSEWLWWEAGMQTSEEVALEGTGPTSVYGGLFVRWRASAGLPDGFVPARVPSISLDGVDISELTSVAHTPTVTISGESAFRYEVEVVRVFRDSQDESLSTSTVIATITSRGSQISVPPGVLEPGERYVLMVRTAEAPAAGVEQTTTSFSPLLSVTP